MLYVLAAIGLATLVVLMWRAFGPDPNVEQGSAPVQVPPDDDPEFLRRLDQQQRQQGGKQQDRGQPGGNQRDGNQPSGDQQKSDGTDSCNS